MNPTKNVAHDQVFELAPVALFHSDFSGLHRLLARWRANGVTDIEAWIRANPSAIDEYYSQIRVRKVNRRALALYRASSFEHLMSAASTIFAGGDRLAPIAEIAAFWRDD
jgi:hypothetical protein